MASNQTLTEALRIAELGYRVLPCNQVKEPIIKRWPEAATSDPQQIKDWFANGNYLLAVLTGPANNLFVVDVDPDGMNWLDLANTVTSSKNLLIPFYSERMEAWRVTSQVNVPSFDNPGCLEKLE